MWMCPCVFTGNTSRLSLQVSGDGMRVLLVAITGQTFLWECMDVKDLSGLRDGTVNGRWTLISPLEDSILPSLQDKEASQHTIFSKTEVSNWIEYIYIIWHIASVFSHWKTCTPFLFSIYPTLSYFIFFRLWVMSVFHHLFSHLGRSWSSPAWKFSGKKAPWEWSE